MKKVLIIDYGMGNLRSVYNAFSLLGCHAVISDNPLELGGADYTVLPGVGSFGDGMKNLRTKGWLDVLNQYVIQKGKPFLGICLGMQLLATVGYEGGANNGLAWVAGSVSKIKDGHNVRIPHIGWNDVNFISKSRIYKGLKEPQTFYFVHSYVFSADNKNVVSGIFRYGEEYAASIEKDNICAVQFHPEKSQNAGIALIKNFLLNY